MFAGFCLYCDEGTSGSTAEATVGLRGDCLQLLECSVCVFIPVKVGISLLIPTWCCVMCKVWKVWLHKVYVPKMSVVVHLLGHLWFLRFFRVGNHAFLDSVVECDLWVGMFYLTFCFSIPGCLYLLPATCIKWIGCYHVPSLTCHRHINHSGCIVCLGNLPSIWSIFSWKTSWHIVRPNGMHLKWYLPSCVLM